MKIARILCGLILLAGATTASAQVQRKREPNPNVNKATALCGRDAYPDLIVKSVEIRKSDDMLITVENLGGCDATDTELKVDWADTEAEVKEMSKKQPTDAHWLWVKVPAIAGGESKQIKMYWSGVYGKYGESRMFFAFTVDYAKKIREDDEYNNTFILRP